MFFAAGSPLVLQKIIIINYPILRGTSAPRTKYPALWNRSFSPALR